VPINICKRKISKYSEAPKTGAPENHALSNTAANNFQKILI
jgi:hypothetical protein